MAGRPRNTGTPHISQPEDTRATRARLTAEAEAAQQSRTDELTMITAQERADESDGVWDPEEGLIIPGMDGEQVSQLRESNGIPSDPDEIIEDGTVRTKAAEPLLRDGVGPLGVPVRSGDAPGAVEAPIEEPIPQPRAERLPQVLQPAVREDRKVVVRVNADIEPTIGAGNLYSLKKGRRYRLPVHVANHLDEKGYLSSR